MININIHEFSGYDAAAFLEFLKIDNRRVIRIVWPRATALFESEPLALCLDYAGMALIGQKLNDLDHRFSITFAPMNQKGPFVFVLKTQNKKALAGLLTWLVHAYGKGRKRFYKDAETFLRRADRSKLACPFYYYTALQFWYLHQGELDRRYGEE